MHRNNQTYLANLIVITAEVSLLHHVHVYCYHEALPNQQAESLPGILRKAVVDSLGLGILIQLEHCGADYVYYGAVHEIAGNGVCE